MRTAARFGFLWLFLFLLLCGSRGAPVPIEPKPGVYVAAFRTGKHVTTSDPKVFHQAVDAVVELLKANRVSVREDPARPMIRTADPISLESLLNVARDAGADYLLYVTIDRPVTKWLKIKLECYDMSGKMLWTEEASEAGGMSGKNAVPKTLAKLGKKLVPHLGKPGLPLLEKQATGTPEAPPGKEHP